MARTLRCDRGAAGLPLGQVSCSVVMHVGSSAFTVEIVAVPVCESCPMVSAAYAEPAVGEADIGRGWLQSRHRGDWPLRVTARGGGSGRALAADRRCPGRFRCRWRSCGEFRPVG